MPKPTSRRTPASHPMEAFRSKKTLAVIAGVIVAGFIAALVAFGGVDTESDPQASTSASELPSLTPEVRASLEGPTTCRRAARGRVIASLDDPDRVDVVEGDVAVRAVQRTAEAEGLELVNGQNADEGVVRATFEPVAVGERALGLWIRSGGGVLSPPHAWRLRLLAEPAGAYYERIVPKATVAEATGTWCLDVTRLAGWAAHGDPDPARITGVELTVPGYAGAGAGTTVAFDDLMVISG